MKGIDYRRHPERYRVARGEQGVFRVEPYKSELLPHWRFRTPARARRYANRGGGPQKADAAEIFRRKWRAAAADRTCCALKAAHLAASRRRRRG